MIVLVIVIVKKEEEELAHAREGLAYTRKGEGLPLGGVPSEEDKCIICIFLYSLYLYIK